ncbi:hypothetical protein QYE76_014954 [Lolium multiflorum]|uniref:Uncharacterized protein n=1 Tax=Lolium multiflorum TaxID=4521 RepID=A0AAD8U3Y7_LOLMU|nr:hypothetical protein QYE76_014954 [Lolium multiflorum]
MSWWYNVPRIRKKTSWPEVVGMPADEAENIIRKGKPDATIIVVPEDSPVFNDLRTDRIYIFVDTIAGVPTVALTPRVG